MNRYLQSITHTLCLYISIFFAGTLHAKAFNNILCLGDSLTEGFGVKSEEAWPALLEAELRKSSPKVKVVNAGISGATSASGPGRMKWHLKSHKKEPIDLLILALGANDALRGLDPTAMKKNLLTVIQAAQNENIQVLLAGMKAPPNLGKEYAARYERIFNELKVENKLAMIPFLLDGVAGEPSMNIADGIHPNAAGHKKITETIIKNLKNFNLR
jgi:acyl-CoA thioesterase-1